MTIEVVLQKERHCKNSVIFKPIPDANPIVPNPTVVSSIYLLNEAFKALGSPNRIQLRVVNMEAHND